MKRNLLKAIALVLLSLICLSSFSQAKKNLEYSGFWDSYYFRGPFSLSLGGGAAFYNGDLGGPFDGSDLGPSVQLTANYKPFPKVQFGLLFNYVSTGASKDDNAALTFSTTTCEIGLFGKFYFIDDIVRRHHQFTGNEIKLIKPYATIGFSATTGSGTLDTTNISVGSVAIPLGVGIQFDITRRFAVYLDVNYKFTFDDNLDGYISGNANDSYMTAFVGIQYSPKAKRIKKKKFKAPKSAEGMVINYGNDSTKSTTKTNDDTDLTPNEADPNEEVNTGTEAPSPEEENAVENTEEANDTLDETPASNESQEADEEEEGWDTGEPDEEASEDDDGWDTSTDDGW